MNSQINRCSFTDFNYLILQLFFDLRHDFFNPRRVNPAIGNQLMQGKTRQLSTNRIKAGKDNGFRGIINNNFDTGSCLKSTNISSFTADDSTLNIIVINVENGNCIFNGMLCGNTLNSRSEE